MDKDVNIVISKEIVQPIVEAKIQGAIVAALQDDPAGLVIMIGP